MSSVVECFQVSRNCYWDSFARNLLRLAVHVFLRDSFFAS